MASNNETAIQNFTNRVNTNNTDLNSILATINNLPEAGSNEGLSPENVTLTLKVNRSCDIFYLQYKDNDYKCKNYVNTVLGSTTITLSVAKGSFITIDTGTFGNITISSVSNNIIVYEKETASARAFLIAQINSAGSLLINIISGSGSN